uniref:LOW QUALITY PROTEIN: zinc finger protein 280A-like n=1 Tax=Castor canadensis TaxID=51338 RepID=A0A8B7UB18_CASCN|nr:LOW QUALITY PROTEIN: zinc finger protein 280A-like [Castor canadensis]
MDTGTPTEGVCFWSTHVQNRTFPWTYTNEKVPFALGNSEPVNSFEGLVKTDFSSLASQNNMTSDPKNGNLILLLSDFYYGQHRGDGQPEQKTYTTFKCVSCFKVLKNVKFMNHMKHHLELEKQRSDSWENHTTCQHCHRQFPTPFQLQCHIDSVHTLPEPSAVCKICELSFETDQLSLQHMKDNHKLGEMPYVCQVCNFVIRSSAFADVETHFRTFHENTNKLLCLFCLKIFKTSKSYMNHCWRHWSKKSAFPCSKCWLQFSSLKEETEHKTKSHQIFKKPEPLEGLPPEAKVVVQTSVHSTRGIASIVLSNTDPCLSPVKTKKRKNPEDVRSESLAANQIAAPADVRRTASHLTANHRPSWARGRRRRWLCRLCMAGAGEGIVALGFAPGMLLGPCFSGSTGMPLAAGKDGDMAQLERPRPVQCRGLPKGVSVLAVAGGSHASSHVPFPTSDMRRCDHPR